MNKAVKEGTWDFQCPQFVDFLEGLNSSGRDDVYFDCKDDLSPKFDDVFPNLRTPDLKAKNKYLTKDAEYKLINKMNTALTVIENTPRLALMKKRNFSEKADKKNICQRMTENTRGKMSFARTARIHRSKSVAIIDKIGADKSNKAIGLRKRSSSLGDLKTIKKQIYKEKDFIKKSPSLNDLRIPKKHTFPMTPMCLKRTIIKSKAKIKSTEEMELEEISKLQKQLIAHLRYNEISLKKLKLKPRAYLNPKGAQIKEENLKEVKCGEKGFKPFLEKLNLEQQREPRRNLHKLNYAALKQEAMKINSVFNIPKKAKDAEKASKDNNEVKPKNCSAASSSVSDQKEKEKTQVPKKPVMKKLGFHSGLLFHDNVKKYTVVKPFSFNARINETKDQNSTCEQKSDISLSKTVLNLKADDIKENITQSRFRPTFNPKIGRGLLNLKNSTQYPGSNKKIFEKSVANQVRGLPLSENIFRN